MKTTITRAIFACAFIATASISVTLDKNVYLAQLFKIEGDKYHVYYVGNGEVDVLSVHELAPSAWNVRTRGEYVKDGAEFYSEAIAAEPEKDLPALKAGRWKVRRIDGNEFVCVRLSGGGPTESNLENFDILGYVVIYNL